MGPVDADGARIGSHPVLLSSYSGIQGLCVHFGAMRRPDLFYKRLPGSVYTSATPSTRTMLSRSATFARKWIRSTPTVASPARHISVTRVSPGKNAAVTRPLIALNRAGSLPANWCRMCRAAMASVHWPCRLGLGKPAAAATAGSACSGLDSLCSGGGRHGHGHGHGPGDQWDGTDGCSAQEYTCQTHPDRR